MSESESKMAMVKEWVSSMMAQPNVLTSAQLCVSRIGELLGWTSASGTDFMESLASRIAVGCGHAKDEQDSWITREFPLQEILRQSFLAQKEAEDKHAMFSKRRQACKRKLEKLQLTSEKQKKKCEVALSRAESGLQAGEDAEERSLRLSKRNAMNRCHTNASKIRVVRSSDELFAQQAHVETCLSFGSVQLLACIVCTYMHI